MIRSKLVFLFLFPVLLFFFFHIFYIVPSLRQSIYEAKKDQIRDMTDSGWGILAHFHRQEEEQGLSQIEAQHRALAVLQAMRFGPENLDYFWVNDFQPTMILHPFRPDLEGEDLSPIQDPEEVFLFLEFVEVAETTGSGFVEYMWQYYDEEERIEPKISFVSQFEPWQWILGTGIYLHVIQEMVESQLRALYLWTLFIILFMMVFFFVIGRSIVSPIYAIIHHAHGIGEGDLEQRISQKLLNRSDEIGLLAGAFEKMKNNLHTAFSQLKKSREHLSITLHSIGDAVITTDIHGRINRMNPQAEALTGWTFDEAEGQDITQVFMVSNAETGQQVVDPVHRVLTEGKRVHLANDTLLTARDKTQYLISDSAAPIQDSSGEIWGVVLVFSNLTEQQKTIQSLQDLEERYKHLFHHLPVGLMLEDQQGTIVDVNKTLCSITGYLREELVGNNVTLFVIPENRHLVKENIDRILKGEDIHLEIETVKKDGEIIYMQLDETKIRLPDGRLGILSIQSNITKRKEVELELIRQKKWLEALFVDSTEAIVTADRNHCVLDINKRFEELFLYQLEEIKGMSVDAVMNIGKEDSSDEELTRRLLSGEVVESEGTRYDKEGNPIDVIIKGIPIVVDGKLMGGYGIYSDITERKRAEDKIRYISFHDSLTDLHNRSYLEEEMQRLDTPRQLPISIIMADVNGLKIINDTYGHSMGDELLVAAAQVLKRSCRQEDIVTRWGGDEFVILLPQTTQQEVQLICNRMIEECRRAVVGEVPVQIAFGSATKTDAHEDIYDIFKEAEDLMYKQKLTESKSSRGKIISTLLKTLGEKSDETEEHAWRMQKMAIDVGEKIGLPPSELDRLSLLLTLHDIGKIIIPEEILTKPGKLTEEEWLIVKTHPEIGSRIASSTEDFSHVAKDILSHHERWDGQGYPRGLKEKEIPILARITAIVDSFDVMTNRRSYKGAMSVQEAVMELHRCAGSQFDPDLVAVFIQLIEEYHQP